MQVTHTESPQQKILVEQVKILYRTLLPILAVNLVVSLALIYGLWDIIPQTILKNWLTLMVILLVARLGTYLFYKRKFADEQAQRFGWYFVLGTGMTGLLWGIGSVYLFPAEGLEYQLFILFVLVGMGAGSVSSLTTYLPAFYAYFPVSMIPVTIKLFLIGDPTHLSLGAMTIAYIIALSYFGMNINRTLVQSLKLRFENIDLVQQLQDQKDEAEQANISKSKFLAAASHDLRQPLHALTLFTSVLDEHITFPKVRKVVDQIKASANALQSLFNALLDISRLEAGVMKVERSAFQLQPLLDKLANEYGPQAIEKGLRLTVSGCDHAAHSDPSLLEQILRNYLSNAIRYTDRGDVCITCSTNSDHVKISVHDSGRGIPHGEQKAIFQEFHQLQNPERDRSKGLGLGLAIVQRSAKLLKHRIGLESEPGKGSTFWIAVDRANAAAGTEVVDADLTSGVSFQSAQKPLLIVIDDEISVLEGTKQLLEAWHYEVITAMDLSSALEQLKQNTRKPDAIIVDYRLRDNQTGIEAIAAIHAYYGTQIPALIVTGDIAAKPLREVSLSGFQVLHKPAAPAKLRSFLNNVSSHKGRR